MIIWNRISFKWRVLWGRY